MSSETKIVLGMVALTVAIVVGGIFFIGKAPVEQAATIPTDQMKLLSQEGMHTKGNNESKVVLTEFLDFECEACGAAYPIVKRLVEEYKGDVKFAVRNFPLPGHRNSRTSAHAAEAAAKQGKFWEMHDKLFEGQREWGEKQVPQTEVFVRYAQELGLNLDQFKQDMEDPNIAEKVQKGVDDGNALGVNSTPTFFLNNERVEGIPPYEEFKAKIDAALKK